jgi:hypothetical protein
LVLLSGGRGNGCGPIRLPLGEHCIKPRRTRSCRVAAYLAPPHAPAMFVVTEADAAAIRAVYQTRGEFSAAVELRRLFPSITERNDLPEGALGDVPVDPRREPPAAADCAGDPAVVSATKCRAARSRYPRTKDRGMSETDVMKGPPIGALHEVRATFRDPEAMQNAVSQLEMSGFDRADLSLPEVLPPAERATPESGATEVDTEEDARQTRTLHTSGAAAVVGLAAAGIVVATGGAAAPAVAAAVAGGGLAGGAAFALSSAANQAE